MRFEKTKISKFYSFFFKAFLKLYKPFYYTINKDDKYIKKELSQEIYTVANISNPYKELRRIRYENVIAAVFYNPSANH